MQTQIHSTTYPYQELDRAGQILRSCVRCGFCLPACPTYRLLGDERESPRGRIYLIKEMLEDGKRPVSTREHLDRCLTCGACETACPSGVNYLELLEFGRQLAEEAPRRRMGQRMLRRLILATVPTINRWRIVVELARIMRAWVPARLARHLPQDAVWEHWPAVRHGRKLLVYRGCAQTALTPAVDTQLARMLDALGVSLIPIEPNGCCGALDHHLANNAHALDRMRQTIDACIEALDTGVEGIIVSSSGCARMLADYGRLFADDAIYRQRAARVADHLADPAELLLEMIGDWRVPVSSPAVAWHAPCTRKHAAQVPDRVPELLRKVGVRLIPISAPEDCCGSAGAYSLLQPQLAVALRDKRLRQLEEGNPACIITANIGCQIHLGRGTLLPVRHWQELLAELYLDSQPSSISAR